jgi:hypothetical protein
VSHITIIIGSKGHSFAESSDEVEITYTPDDLNPEQIGKEVARRIKWLDTLRHVEDPDAS